MVTSLWWTVMGRSALQHSTPMGKLSWTLNPSCTWGLDGPWALHMMQTATWWFVMLSRCVLGEARYPSAHG